MSDVLSLVRQATRTNATVSYNDKYYTFGNQKLHESTKTCFKRTLKGALVVYFQIFHIQFFNTKLNVFTL